MTMLCLSDVLNPLNLLEAWERVRTNKGVGGVDGVSLGDFELNLQHNLDTLRNEVEYETYRPLPLLRVYIDKPSGDGTRPLSIPTIRDRVLQTAVTLKLTPLFEAEFEEVSFAYRQGRSVAQAVSMIERLRDKGYQWVVDADIHRYFDEVNHDLLMHEVEKLVSDKGILRLIRQWLTMTVVDRNHRFTLNKGVPQGSPLSPLLANLFLDHLDETLLDKNLRLVRYADDFVVLCKSADKAADALALTGDILEQLRLRFNRKKTRVVDFNTGFRFLGVQFIRSLAFKSKQPERLLKDRTATNNTADKKTITSSTATDKTDKHKKKRTKSKTIDYTDHTDHTTQGWFSYALPEGSVHTSSDEMREAFSEAGLSPLQFPSEALPDEHFQPPEAETRFDEVTDNKPDIPHSNSPRLKTLYLMEHGSVLGKDYERFVVKRKGLVVKEIPAIHVDQIMVFGHSQLTTQVMHFCLQQRIPIYLLSGKGRFYGMVDSFDTEPVLLHKEQFLRADDASFCLHLAKSLVRGKIANSRVVLQRQARYKDAPAFSQANTELAGVVKRLDSALSLDQLRGFEGNAARIYFQSLAATLDKQWGFSRRVKQPPTDPINALLSYGYTLLFYNIYTFLRVRGLNPHVGYLHPMRMGHPALASDMMEEFRSIVVDAVVFNLVFNNKLSPDDFVLPTTSGEPCLLTADARSLFIRHLEAKLNASVRHPVSLLKLDYRRCMEHQINHLARVIRLRDASYQAMVLR